MRARKPTVVLVLWSLWAFPGERIRSVGGRPLPDETASRLSSGQTADARHPLLLDPAVLRALLEEASGERVLRETAELAALARYPASRGFHRAAELVAERARQIGLTNVRILSFPAPIPRWDIVRGDLWLVRPEKVKLADASRIGVSVAQFSRPTHVAAELVFVGPGTADADYVDKDVRGKIVLASGPLSDVEEHAVERRGALGIVSFYQGEFFGTRPSPEAVSWGALSPRSKGFAFMISPSMGKKLIELAESHRLKVRARIEIERSEPGFYEMVVGEIPGTTIKNQDIVFSAHLDHQPPGANDNASGSAALLEVARVIRSLVTKGTIAPLRRTIRFWWVTEIVGTYAYFFAHPEEARRILANINIDQAGGDRHGRSDFVAILQPPWMGTFLDDVIRVVAEDATERFAEVYHEPSPLFVAPTGTRTPFLLRFWPYAPLSDHVVFETAGIDIPSISLAAASLSYIHTSDDSIEHIDPTALKRSVFLGAACGLVLTQATARDIPLLFAAVRSGGHHRLAEAEGRALSLIARSGPEDIHTNFKIAYHILQQAYQRESQIMASLARLHSSDTERETGSLFRYEANFTWTLFGEQEAAVAVLTSHYERICRLLGVEARELQPTLDEVRLNDAVATRIVALGSEFPAWLAFTSQRLGPRLSEKIKSLIDGQRSLAEIYWATIGDHPTVTAREIEEFIYELKAKGWVKITQRR